MKAFFCIFLSVFLLAHATAFAQEAVLPLAIYQTQISETKTQTDRKTEFDKFFDAKLKNFSDSLNTPETPAKINRGDILDIKLKVLHYDKKTAKKSYKDLSRIDPGFINKKDHKYKVDMNGQLNLPFIAKTDAAGLSEKELSDIIHKKISNFYRYSKVQVNIFKEKIYTICEIEDNGNKPLNRSEIMELKDITLKGNYSIEGGISDLVLKKTSAKNTAQVVLSQSCCKRKQE